MEHPIGYRIAMYSIIGTLCSSIYFLVSLLNYSPFSYKDMVKAYKDGCNIGYHKPLTQQSMDRCEDLSVNYGDTLNELDKKMETYDSL